MQEPTHFGPFFALATPQGRIGTLSRARSKDPAPSLALIQRSAWKAKFSEVGMHHPALPRPVASLVSALGLVSDSASPTTCRVAA